MECFTKKLIDKNLAIKKATKKFIESQKTVDFLEMQKLITDKQILINSLPLPF